MKTIQQLTEQQPVYVHGWGSIEDIMKDFEEVGLAVNVLFASYGYENYEGDAFVLFEKDGELFEVNGSHCSCYGLEGQWSPEETTIKALAHRLNDGYFGKSSYCGNEFNAELKEFLGV